MHVVDRTSVQVYFAQSKSSIHVPPKSGIDPDIVDWILLNEDLRLIQYENANHIQLVQNDLRVGLGKELPAESVERHLKYLADRAKRTGSEDWDEVGARAHELDVFTGSTPGFVVPDGRFLEFHEASMSGLDATLFGSSGVIERVVCLTRLTETRVQDGFTRFVPGSVSPQEGFELMWGHHNRGDSWLPAYRAYGEGILLVFNPTRLHSWARSSGMPPGKPGTTQPVTFPAVLAHSLAHLIMVKLADECGYSLPSIRDRVYDLPDGRVAVLVYTADSDIMGTLGGLVEFGEGKKLERLVALSFNSARWCSQDPVCISRDWDHQQKQGACCHQCLLVPETSCELMNRHLDRATLVGSRERKVLGIN